MEHNVIFNLEKRSNKLFILLILADLVFMLIHVLYTMDVVTNPLWSIKKDFGYAERYQYIKEGWIVLLLFIMAIKRSHIIYLTWSTLFMYLLLDDSLRIHERMGSYLFIYFKLQPAFNLRGQDFGELGVSMLFGSLLFLFIGCAYLFCDTVAKQISKHLFILVLALAFCGVFVDTFHRAIPFGPFGKSIRVLVEDGGEMLIMSIIVVYVFNLKVTSKESTIVHEYV